jgi:DNA-binding FadR family transcriptional regulator
MDELHDALRARILSDEWLPGQRIPSERDLAAAYGTNRNTLREAIRRLEESGLVSVRHGQGVTVRDFRSTGALDLVAPFLAHGSDLQEKAQMILDVLEPRKRVLEYVVERFLVRFVAEDMVEIERARQAIEAAETARSAAQLVAAETQFYELLVLAARDQVVRWLARPLLDLNRDIQTRWSSLVVFEPRLSSFVAKLIAASAQRDVVLALAELRNHYDAIDENVRRGLLPMVQTPSGLAPSSQTLSAEATSTPTSAATTSAKTAAVHMAGAQMAAVKVST